MLLTLDLDFADIRAFPPQDCASLIVLRVRDQSRRHIRDVMQRVFDLLAREPVQRRLWIVTDSSIRIRG